MSLSHYVAAYFASWLIATVIAFATRRNGYGSTFPSAASAIALNMIWPVLLAFAAFILACEYLGPAWDRVERWWDQEPQP